MGVQERRRCCRPEPASLQLWQLQVLERAAEPIAVGDQHDDRIGLQSPRHEPHDVDCRRIQPVGVVDD